ncbi:MAG: hypothetical protein ABH858_06145 [Candidatus Omnitrophota bacterium]
MEQDNNTAERELLKAIEGNSNLKKIPKGRGPVIPFLSKEIIGQLVGRCKDVSAAIFVRGDLDQANRVFIVVLAFIMFSFGMVMFRGFNRLRYMPRFDIAVVNNPQDSGAAAVLKLKPLAYYTGIVLGRNIFVPFDTEKKSESLLKGSGGSNINELIRGLRVVGISWDKDNKGRFVMLEDIKTQATYPLREGEALFNITVKEIFQDKVVVTYMEEEAELR